MQYLFTDFFFETSSLYDPLREIENNRFFPRFLTQQILKITTICYYYYKYLLWNNERQQKAWSEAPVRIPLTLI